MVEQGIEQAWEQLASRDPRDVSVRAAVEYSERESCYRVPVLGHVVRVDPKAHTLAGSSPEAESLLNKLAYFSRLSVLHYLLGAQRLEPSGRLLKPEELKSGQFYARGSHKLPLDQLATRYSEDAEAFLAQGRHFGGEARDYGDAAVELRPFPRVPVTLILWQADEEFPAASSLLFDETCELHLPPDIVWSVAMMCTLAMLRG